MYVFDILKEKGSAVFATGPEMTIGEAVVELAKRRIGSVLVCDGAKTGEVSGAVPAGDIVGILSERDIVRSLAESGTQGLERKVEAIMSRKVVTCAPSDTVKHVKGLMTDGRFRHVPVVDEVTLIGLISIGDVVKHRLEETKAEVAQLADYVRGG